MSDHSPSLRDALAASIDAHTPADTSPMAHRAGTSDTGTSAPVRPNDSFGQESTPAPAQTATGQPDGSSGGSAPAPSADGRPRDASGRFAPTTDKPAASVQTSRLDATAQAPDGMPDGYDANVWNMLSPEARAQTAAWAGKQRETVAERDARLKGYEPIDRVLTQQRRDALAMQYGGVDQALSQLFALSDFAARDPRGFMQHFAQQRGLNLAQLVQHSPNEPFGRQGQEPQAQQQPTPQQAIQAMVQQEIDRRDVNRLYDEFAGQADLEHRNDPQVRATMAALLAANQATDYRSAYDMAVRAHPQHGLKWAQAQAAATTQAQQAVAAETARARAQAASSVTGAPGTTRPPSSGAPATVRDAVVSALASAEGARV